MLDFHVWANKVQDNGMFPTISHPLMTEHFSNTDIASLRNHTSIFLFSSSVFRLFHGQMQNCLREGPGMSAWCPRVTWRMAGNRTTSPSLSRVPLADIWMSSLSTDEPSRSDHTSCCACNRSPLPICIPFTCTETLQYATLCSRTWKFH